MEEVDGEDDEDEIPRAALKVTRKKKEKVLRPPSPEPEEYLVDVQEDEPQPAVVKPKAPRKSRKPEKSMKPVTPVTTQESDNEATVEVVEEEAPVVEVVKKAKGKAAVEDRRTITRAVKEDSEEEVQQEQIPQPPPKPSKGKARAEPLTDRNVDPVAVDDAMSLMELEPPAPQEPKPKKAPKAKVKAAPKAKATTNRKPKPTDAAPKARTATEVPDEGDVTTESEVLSESHPDVSEGESTPTSNSAMDVDPAVDGTQHIGEKEVDDRPNLPPIGHLQINGTSGPAKPVSKAKIRMDEQTSRIPSPTTPRNKPVATVPPPPPPPQATSQMDTRTPKKQSLHALPPALAAINPEQVSYSFTAEEREMSLQMFVERKMQEAQAQFEADGEREISEFLGRAAEVRKRLEAL